jgi:hypothetical protein
LSNQHRYVGVRHPFDQLADLGHPTAGSKQHVVFRLCLQLLAQRRDLACVTPVLERVLERHCKIRLLERLADEVSGAELHRLHDRRRASLARDQDDRHVAIDLLERRERGEAVHAARHDDIEDHRGRTLLLEHRNAVFGVACRRRDVPACVEEPAQVRAHLRVVVDDEDQRSFIGGRCGIDRGSRSAIRLMSLHWHGRLLSNAGATVEIERAI